MSIIPKIKYLTNKELLIAINDSKSTFCDFVDKKYKTFDIIVQNLDSVTDEMILAARAKRLGTLIAEEKKKYGKTHESLLTLDDISSEDIVVRVMTYAHIPLDPAKEDIKTKTTNEKHFKVNFPPFQHWIKKDQEWICVGKSHMKNGVFSISHGKITNHLAAMWMKLVERYGHRGNWRGYCVDTQTQALTQRGWLYYNEITTDDTILSYDIENKDLKWSNIKSIFQDHYSGKMFHMTVTGLDALVTPGHKWVTQNGLKEVEYLLEKDSIILGGGAINDSDNFVSTYSDEFVEIIGWVVTEGNFYYRSPKSCRVTIYQNEGPRAMRIRNCLNMLKFRFSEFIRHRDTANFPQVAFTLSKAASDEICKVIDKKSLHMNFILSLSKKQRELLIQTMIEADGWIRKQKGLNGLSYCQKDKNHMDMFLALCTMSGYRASCHKSLIGKNSYIHIANIFSEKKHSNVENIDFHGAKRTGKHNRTVGKGKLFHPNEPTVDYDGIVWCPQTEYGTFVARRNGYIYITGNSYLDEMRAQALVQLSQVGLQFDESKSNNPFSYYSQICSTSFLKILNLEKRNQHIRDDLLIMHGNMPSHTRQVEDQLGQNPSDDSAPTPTSPPTNEE